MPLPDLYDRNCKKCGLCSEGISTCIPGRGSAHADIMLVGEAPGYNEDKRGTPFIGKAGVHLSECLKQAGLNESDLFITNVVKCRPPDNRDPEPGEVLACSDYLWEEIDRIRPKVIIALGKPATQALLAVSFKEKMGKLRGEPRMGEFYLGEDGEEVVNIPVLPTWHPAYCLRSSRATPELTADLAVAMSVAKPKPRANYRMLNNVEAVSRWTQMVMQLYERGEIEYLACDIETDDEISGSFDPRPYSPDTNIASIQFAWAPGKSILIPIIRRRSVFNNAANLRVLRACLKRIFEVIPIAGQNFKFDMTYLWCKLGIPVPHLHFDTMLAHHFLFGGGVSNDLGFLKSRYLGEVSHKSVIDEPLSKLEGREKNYGNLPDDILTHYGCEDTDATFRLVPILIEKMRAQDYRDYGSVPVHFANMHEAFRNLMMFPWKAIVEIELGGAATDQARFPEVADTLYTEMRRELGVIHDSRWHKPFQDKTKTKNKKRTKVKKKCQYRLLCANCGSEVFVDPPKPKKIPPCRACHGNDIQVNRKMMPTGEVELDHSQPEWIYTEFNPRSTKQVSFLVYDLMRLPPLIPGKETSVDKHVRAKLIDYCNEEGLSDHRAVIDALSKYSSAQKLHSNYGARLPDFIYVATPEDEKSKAATAQFEPPTGVGFLHTSYKQDGTVSGRLSTVSPPLHTIPRKSIIKELFISRFGEMGLILQGDYGQAEVRAFVVETGDEGLRDAFRRGDDPHALMASRSYLIDMAKVTEDLRQDAKAITFGILFGRGAAAIADQTGKTVDEMKEVMRAFFKAAPKVKKWIDSQHAFVDKHKCVLSRLGRIRYLKDEVESGDSKHLSHAHNVGVNHPIQGMVGDICTNAVARIHYRLRAEGLKSVVTNTVHDSVVLDVFIPELFRVYHIVKEEMQDKLTKIFPFINVPMVVDMSLGVNWCHQLDFGVPDDGVLDLSGSLDYLTPVANRLRRSWKVRPSVFDSGEKNGRRTVHAVLQTA